MKPNQYGKLKALSRLARESPFKGERQAAEAAIKRLEQKARGAEDPRLTDEQFNTIKILRGSGFIVTYEFGVDKGTVGRIDDIPTATI